MNEVRISRKKSFVAVALTAFVVIALAVAGLVGRAYADDPSPQAAGSWTASGTCEWEADQATKTLTIRPANGAQTGQLDDKPWTDSSLGIENVVFESANGITIKGNDGERLFDGCSTLKSLDLSGLNTSGMTTMESMFRNCTALESVDLSGWDTARVTEMSFMFLDCSSLKAVDVTGFDTSRVVYMGQMFHGCSSLKELDLSHFKTGNVIDMCIFFRGCTSLEKLDLTGWNVSKASSFEEFFGNCSALKELDLSSFNPKSACSLWAMFRGCSSLKELDLSGWDTSKVWMGDAMFADCSSLSRVNLSGFNTSEMTGMNWMFQGCSSLKELDLSSFNTAKVLSSDDMFPVGLTQLTIGASFTLQSSIPAGTWRNVAGTSFQAADIPTGVADTYVKTQNASAQSVTIDIPGTTTILEGGRLHLTAVVNPVGVADPMAWTSSDPSVATIDANGWVSAVAPGSVTMTVTVGSVSDAIALTVKPRVQSLTLSEATKTVLDTDAPFTLTATVNPAGAFNGAVVWSTSNAAVATVSAMGVVTPVGAGTATITASAGGLTAQCVVTVQSSGSGSGSTPVTPPPTTSTSKVTLSLDQTSKTFVVGDEPFALTATVSTVAKAGEEPEVDWSSTNPSVATVDANGLVTPLKTGSASIVAKAGDATEACAVTVNAKSMATGQGSDIGGYVVIEDSALAQELAGLQLQIKESSRSADPNLIQAVLKSAQSGSFYVDAMEIDLTDAAGGVQPWRSADQSLKVHITLNEKATALMAGHDMSVHYVDEAIQNTEAMPTWIEGNDLVFETSHFSTYAIAAKPSTSNPIQNNVNVGDDATNGGPGAALAQTGDDAMTVAFMLLFVAVCAGVSCWRITVRRKQG